MKIPIIITSIKGKTKKQVVEEVMTAVNNFYKKKKELEGKSKKVDCEVTFVPEYHKKEEEK